jgi:DNA-binding MarR family transcriptional regulator
VTTLTPIEFLRALRRAGKAVEERMLRDLHAAGFPELRRGHLTILRHLDPPGRRTTDLARAAEVSRQAVSQLVSDLEELGIVEQARDPTDGRARIVTYTERGLEGYGLAVASFERVQRELGDALGADSIDRLMSELEAVRDVAARDGAAAA